MTKATIGIGSKGILVVAALFGTACDGGGLTEPMAGAGQVEATPQSLTAVDIDRVLGFEATTVSDWAIIQSGPGTLSVSTTASQGSRSLAVASHGYVPVQSVALTSLGSRVGSVIHYDIMLPSQLKQISPYYYGATQLYLNSTSLGLSNTYLGQVDLTPLPVGQWNTLTFTPTSSVLTKLRGTYTDLQVTIVVNAPYNATQPYLLDNLRFSDSTLALVAVVDGSGHPLSGLTVTAYNGSTATSNTGVTDSTGLAKVWVAPGSYRFGVTEAGVTTYSSATNQCQVPGICAAATIIAKCHGVVCTAKDTCHNAGTCDPGTGVCSNPPKTGEAACIDDLMQYSNDNTCSSITPMGLHFEALAQQDVSDSTLTYLGDASQQPDIPSDMSSSTWHVFPVTLYPSGTPVVSDVNQHDIGDCGGMSVLADLAYLAPAFIQSMITDNQDGTFAVAVYDPKGTSRTLKIDSRFLADSSNNLQAAGTKNKTANWATVLEKVAMKYLHAFPVRDQLGGIDPQDMAPMFTGTGCSYNFDRTLPSAADFRRVVEVSLRHGKLLVGGFSGDNKSGTDYGKNPGHVGNIGLSAGHYYSGFWPADSSMMVMLRNPYGNGGSPEGLIDFPLNQTDPSIAYTWEKYMGLRVVYPGVAGTTGRTTPYVYVP